MMTVENVANTAENYLHDNMLYLGYAGLFGNLPSGGELTQLND